MAALLSDQIHRNGPMRFDEFMQISLYQQDMGYYASGQTRPGAQGDFLTPVSPGPVLGQLLALQITELHSFLNTPPTFHLIEQGADRAHLALDILSALSQKHSHLLSSLHLHLIEPSPALAQKQKVTLDPFLSKLSTHWHPNLVSLPALSEPAYFYSCELIDSFPVRLIRFNSGQWHERWVTLNQDHLDWLDQPASPELLRQIHHWSIPTIENFCAEIRPAVSPWMQLLSQKIQQGLLLTLDYGFLAPDLYHPSRSAGTLVALRQHTPSPNPLDLPGDQDLTAHVNFTELIEEGNRSGWQSYGPLPFLSALTYQATPFLRDEPVLSEKWTRNFQHLTHPSFFGQTHSALLQSKNLPPSYRPSMFAS